MPTVPKGVDKLRGQWLAPFILSPHNSGIIYFGTQFLHRSMNEGETWELISDDLTYNNTEKKGDIPYQTIFSLSESPMKFGLLYAGTDDGRVWMTKNSGDNWLEINKGLPYGKWVSQIEASAFSEGRVYMTQNGKRDDDFAAYIWKSEDYGQTWSDLKANIPCGPVNVIKEDPQNENILYVGTDFGVYVSLNKGESWESMPGKLPTTYVHDLVIHPRDDFAVIATHGRGVWALDIRFVREIAKMDSETDCRILEIEDCELPRGLEYWYRRSAKEMHAPFYIKNDEEVLVSISNSNQEKVKEFKIKADKGLNFIDWDLMVDEEKMGEPGTYQLKLEGSNFKEEKTFEVKNAERRR
jgi:hypothetical protein